MSKAWDAHLVCLGCGDTACCPLIGNPVLIVRLWRLMECLSVILGPSVFHLNDSPLFILSARFIPKGKPWQIHTHVIWSKRSRKEWGQSSRPKSLIPSLDYVSKKKKKKSLKCDFVAKMILLLLHTICNISESGCFELQKSELTISVVVLSPLNCDKISHFGRQKWYKEA